MSDMWRHSGTWIYTDVSEKRMPAAAICAAKLKPRSSSEKRLETTENRNVVFYKTVCLNIRISYLKYDLRHST
jgi:hypothetical protein